MKHKLGSEWQSDTGKTKIIVRAGKMYGPDTMEVVDSLSKYELMGLFSDITNYLNDNPTTSVENLLVYLRMRAQENAPWLEEWLKQG